jgi:serpin B
MSAFRRIFFLILICILLAGCAPNPVAGVQEVKSNKSQVTAPQVPAADLQALAQGNSAFAVDLYHKLGEEPGNFFYSPYSISAAFAMAYAGAKGETARQMAETLHFTLSQEQLHPAFNALAQELASRTDLGGQAGDAKGFRFNVVNDLWGQKNYAFLPEYLDLLAQNYGAGMRPVDFIQDPEAARKIINDYIAEKTERRITDLIPQGAIDPLTRLVLTNAIYFNAAWTYPFDENLTAEKPFTLLDGKQINVPTMAMSGIKYLNYADGDGYQAVALPYEGGKLSMLILVPDAGNFTAFEGRLEAGAFGRILSEMQQVSVRVSMPKFQIDSDFLLSKPLSTLGIKDAFVAGTADFSGIDGKQKYLYISEAIHKAFVKVDENGTEAAAATAVMMPAAGMPQEPVNLTIDRPFIFMIRDEPTGSILFTGRLVDLTK